MNEQDIKPTELEKRTATAVKLGRGVYDKAAEVGMSVSAFMESIDPSSDTDQLDAFQRVLAQAGIRTKSVPEKGIFADKVERFYASNVPQSQFLFPEFINREMRQVRQQQDFTGDLLAARTPVDSNVYQTIYLDMADKTQLQMKRVAEHGELPRVKMKTSEQAVYLKKYGLMIEATYEAMRRMRIDLVRVHLGEVALRTGLDKMDTIVDVIINGDGNSNGATNSTTVGLDSTAGSGTVTYKAWISWLMSFFPYQCTTVAGTMASLIKLLTMAFPGGDPLQLLAQFAGEDTGMKVQLPNGIFTTIKLAIAPSAPADTLIGIDRRYGIEELSEIGASLTETDKIISQQFNEIALSEVVGYGVIYKEALRTLTISS